MATKLSLRAINPDYFQVRARHLQVLPTGFTKKMINIYCSSQTEVSGQNIMLSGMNYLISPNVFSEYRFLGHYKVVWKEERTFRLLMSICHQNTQYMTC